MMEDVVIVGAGISGLSTALGLQRLGIRSLVLEASESLRVSGFGLTTWANAWKALDVLGVADTLRQQHTQLDGVLITSMVSGGEPSEVAFRTSRGVHEVRCLKRRALLETLAERLPEGSIRFSSKVVGIEEESGGWFKVVHLADGVVIKTKVLIGCDGVNSEVAKWLGFKKPVSTDRHAIRGYAHFANGHGLQPKFFQFFGDGNRSGFIPCDDNTIYWFLTHSDEDLDPSDKEALKRFVAQKLASLPDHLKNVIQVTRGDNIASSPLRFRPPWQLLHGNISKGNVCVAGDALHPMPPDMAQGGCSALEDAVVLARCIGEALLSKNLAINDGPALRESEEYTGIELGLKKYAQARKWRSFDLVATSYAVGFIQQSSGKIMGLLRDQILALQLAGLLLKKGNFDCGMLYQRSKRPVTCLQIVCGLWRVLCLPGAESSN